MKKTVHYFNGSWVTADKTNISIFDLSVIRGFGIFDFFRTYNHVPCKLPEHIDRLFNSAKYLSIRVPETKARIKKLVFEGIKKNHLPDYSIRIVVTGGVSPDGISRSDLSSFAILFTPALNFSKTCYTEGVAVITHHHERPFFQAKSLNYLTAVTMLAQARKKNAVEVLYLDHDDNILEGTTSSFFGVQKGTLVTPKDHILPGITRKTVLDIAKRLKIRVEQVSVPYKSINTFDEAFITASNKEVMPVVKIDGKKIGTGKVGSVTRLLQEEYRKEVGS